MTYGHGRFNFVFDVPSGVFLSADLTEQLEHRARERGPVLDLYGAVVLRTSLERLTLDDPTLKVLVYQRRWLNQKFFPVIYPHLRAAMPVDFGRSRRIVWYDPAFERALIPEGSRLSEIDPEAIL